MPVLLVAVVLAGAAGIPVSASVPAGASARGWSVTPSPNPVIPTGQLFWVSCPAANSCMAVGTYTKASGSGVTLAERWNGTSWRVLPTPNPSGMAFSNLFGVACTSTSACTAVGVSVSPSGASRAVAERWNGTRWRIQPTPNLSQGGDLNGVSCTSASACTAAGNSNAGNLAERWNGPSWRIQPTPNPGGAQFTFLNTVACASASACTAAGAYIDSSGAFQGLAERWDGSSWAIQPTPHLASGAMNLLIGVACTSPAGCLAVGYSIPNGGGNQSPATLAERWNGSTWRAQHTPSPPGAAASNLNAASCVSRSACVAVGNTSNSRGTSLPLAQRWNGHTWNIQPTPSPADGGVLQNADVFIIPAAGGAPTNVTNDPAFWDSAPDWGLGQA